MKTFATSFAALVVAAQAAFVDIHAAPQGSTVRPVPNRYVVELAPGTGLRREAPHAAVYERLRARGVPMNVDKEYNVAEIFVGASVTLGVQSLGFAYLTSADVELYRMLMLGHSRTLMVCFPCIRCR